MHESHLKSAHFIDRTSRLQGLASITYCVASISQPTPWAAPRPNPGTENPTLGSVEKRAHKRCIYCCELYIVGVHPCLKEAVCHVQRGEDFSLAQVSQYLIDQWDGETVSDCIAIKLPVVVHPSWQNIWVIFWDDERTTTCGS